MTCQPSAPSKDSSLAISVADLRKAYERRVAIDGLSFHVSPGEVVGLLGPNGAGKTVTAECISGLRRPNSGHISVFGMNPADESGDFRQSVGVQLQSGALPNAMTPRRALELFASFYPHPADAGELTQRLNLADYLSVPYGQLSGGQRQRLAVALALIGRPRLAILDELTTGLDPAARRQVWQLLEELANSGTAILLVSHFMEEVERLCDRVVVLRKGRAIFDGTPQKMTSALVSNHRVVFTPPLEVDLTDLLRLSSVRNAQQDGDEIVIDGTNHSLFEIVQWLSTKNMTPLALRTDRPSLDEAYLALIEQKDRI